MLRRSRCVQIFLYTSIHMRWALIDWLIEFSQNISWYQESNPWSQGRKILSGREDVRPGHPSHSMSFALILPKGGLWMLPVCFTLLTDRVSILPVTFCCDVFENSALHTKRKRQWYKNAPKKRHLQRNKKRKKRKRNNVKGRICMASHTISRIWINRVRLNRVLTHGIPPDFHAYRRTI